MWKYFNACFFPRKCYLSSSTCMSSHDWLVSLWLTVWERERAMHSLLPRKHGQICSLGCQPLISVISGYEFNTQYATIWEESLKIFQKKCSDINHTDPTIRSLSQTWIWVERETLQSFMLPVSVSEIGNLTWRSLLNIHHIFPSTNLASPNKHSSSSFRQHVNPPSISLLLIPCTCSHLRVLFLPLS